jgi:hypothetical protein
MLIAALFTIAKLCKKLGLTTNEWIKKIWYTNTMEYLLFSHK